MTQILKLDELMPSVLVADSACLLCLWWMETAKKCAKMGNFVIKFGLCTPKAFEIV